MTRVALFCGSARRFAPGPIGANLAALQELQHVLDDRRVRCVTTPDVSEIPAFRAEQVDDAPLAVQALRTTFESADAVVLATPEFGGGAAGAAKNALDWMVGSGSLYERPCFVISAGTTGGSNSIEQISRTLTWQGAFVMQTLGIATPTASRDEQGRFVDRESLGALARMAEAVVDVVSLSEETRRDVASRTVRALGIDPTRRSGR